MSKPFYPVGAHVCRATGQSLGETRNGNVQFVLNFVVLGMPDPKNPDNYLSLAAVKQKPRSWYCVLNENTIGFAREELRSIGFEQSPGRLDPSDSKAHIFRDKLLDMYCTRDDADRERWRPSRPKSAGSRPAVSKDRVDKLDQLWGEKK